MDNLKASLENLKDNHDALSESSQKHQWRDRESRVTPWIQRRKSADDLQLVIADARKTMQTAGRSYPRSENRQRFARDVVEQPEAVANDLQALISNFRAHGVFFIETARAKEAARARYTRSNAAPTRTLNMTPLLTVNLLRVLFVTFCATIGGMVAVEVQQRQPGIIIGVVFGLFIVLADRLLKGFSLRAFSSATFGLLLGMLFANLLMASDILRYQSDIVQWAARLMVYCTFGYLGMMLAMRSNRDEFSLIIPYVRFARETTQHEPSCRRHQHHHRWPHRRTLRDRVFSVAL